ncbi:MAG: SAM-dependent methyltransferase [Proteobacteria bacterium]|nr:MAG: SAM-dependent methyltransferase [Pseudomonadota bacterium]
MKLATLLAMLRGDLLAALSALGPVRQAQRVAFLAGAGGANVLPHLAGAGATLDEVAKALGIPDEAHDALASWLRIGVQLGDLRERGGRYALRSRLARTLADPRHAAVLGIVEQQGGLYHRVIREAPYRLRVGAKLALGDVDGELVARASKILEPLVCEAVDERVPVRGAFRLLEVGCGSAVYVRRAAQRNPALTALALDVDPAVVDQAREDIAAWGLEGRIAVACADVMAHASEPVFDLVTLHNCIYYFPLEQREPLLAKLRGFCRPGGHILVTTACRGGSVVSDVLSLWGSLTEGCGRLPDRDELLAQLGRAGWRDAGARNLLPGDSVHRFVARA